jgi:hypothetical protein
MFKHIVVATDFGEHAQHALDRTPMVTSKWVIRAKAS